MAVGANVTDFAEQAVDVDVRGAMDPGFDGILTPRALGFMASLHRAFNPRRLELLGARELRQAEFDAGARPDFLTGTAGVRDGDWSVSPVPQDLQNRRVEITGPVDRKMIINALNSGASVFMADFEDATTPTWSNLLDGQLNLRDTNGRTIDFDDPQSGRHYELADEIAETGVTRPQVIDEDTTVRGFQKEVRWNQAHYRLARHVARQFDVEL